MNVAVLSQHFLSKTQKELSIIQLRHPRTDYSCSFLYSADTNQLQELVEYKEANRSWFIDQSVQPGGALILGTPVDPLFLVLPYLQKQFKNYCPLEDILNDEDFPHNIFLLKCCKFTSLSNISSQKDVSGNFVYKYSKDKTVHWLQKKVKNVAFVLEEKCLDVSEGSRLATYIDATIETDQSAYLRYACNLVGEYLTEELCLELSTSLGLSQDSENPSKSKRDSPVKAIPNPKKLKREEPLEDYSSFGKTLQEEAKAKNVKLTAAQKQLQKVNKKGMKSISTFFGNVKK